MVFTQRSRISSVGSFHFTGMHENNNYNINTHFEKVN